MVLIYKEPLCRRYYSGILGEATIFRVVAHLSAIVLAFVVAFATGGFWIKLKPDNIQAAVHYTYDALLFLEVRTLSCSPQTKQTHTNAASTSSLPGWAQPSMNALPGQTASN